MLIFCSKYNLKYSTLHSRDVPWKKAKRDHFESEERCPSFTNIIQPLDGTSTMGRILDLYRDQNSKQNFQQTPCASGVKGRPCRFIENAMKHESIYVQPRYIKIDL